MNSKKIADREMQLNLVKIFRKILYLTGNFLKIKAAIRSKLSNYDNWGIDLCFCCSVKNAIVFANCFCVCSFFLQK